jgi:hypothetical protein
VLERRIRGKCSVTTPSWKSRLTMRTQHERRPDIQHTALNQRLTRDSGAVGPYVTQLTQGCKVDRLINHWHRASCGLTFAEIVKLRIGMTSLHRETQAFLTLTISLQGLIP